MIKCDSQKLFKYGLYMAVIYALLIMIPSQKLKSNDIILIMSSLLIIIVLLDNVGNESFVNIPETNVNPLTVGLNNSPQASENTFTSYAELANNVNNNNANNNNVNNNNNDNANNDNANTDNANADNATENISKSMCTLQLDQIKKDFEKQIETLKSELTVNASTGSESSTVKYYRQLVKELSNNGILDPIDVKNITIKLNNKLITIDDAIASLEKVKEQGVVKERTVNSDFVYSELPSEFYTPLGKRIVTDWENEYNLLDSTNWQVPIQRPPVCMTTEKCKVCPKETYPGTTLLKDWDSSRKISDIKVNKKWASNN